jgi:glycosyltransferase involved in cell wall biosynthesis
MRITFLLPGLDMSGGNRVISIHARMLAAEGHQVLVVVPGPRRVSWARRIVDRLIGSRREPGHASPASHFDGLQLPIHQLNSSRPVVDADLPDADVVVATWWETAEWAHALSPSKGAKVYFVQHHEVFDYLPVQRVKATYRLPLRKIVVAQWLKDVMRDEYNVQEVDLVPNAVDHEQFHAPARSRQAIPTAGFMYSVAGFKSSSVAIEALRKVKAAIPNLRVVSFGHHHPVGLDFLGSDLEFHLLPSQEVIRDCYSRCDVWLSSSNSEGFNLPALEAMACRTPVVSTRTGWPATAIVDGFNGYVVPVGDADALCSGVVQVLGSTCWEQLSQNAHATAAQLTWDESYRLFSVALVRARGGAGADHAAALIDVGTAVPASAGRLARLQSDSIGRVAE